MSDPDEGPRKWRFYLDDMVGFALKVRSYTNGLKQAEFVVLLSVSGCASYGVVENTPAQVTPDEQSYSIKSFMKGWREAHYHAEATFLGCLFRTRSAAERRFSGNHRRSAADVGIASIVFAELHYGTGSAVDRLRTP